MRKLLLAPLKLLSVLVGEFKWSAPSWLLWIARLLNNHRKPTALVLVIALVGFGIFRYIESLPKPISVKADLDSITYTADHESAVPSALNIRFSYDLSVLNDDQLKPQGNPSVARIDLVGEEITSGIRLSPAKNGTWTWVDDRSIQFVPETDWPAGTDYSITFDKPIFSKQTRLSEDDYSFSTPPLDIKFVRSEFYQDPENLSIRRVVATAKFSHPVDKDSFERRLSMGMQAEKALDQKNTKAHGFSVSYNKSQRQAYITSEPVSLPTEPNYMKIMVGDGVSTLLGGASSTEKLEQKTLVPDLYSFLKVRNAWINIVRNSNDEPEQVITLEFTDHINQQELLKKLSVFRLPKDGPTGRRLWNSPRQVDENVLSNSVPVILNQIPNERDSSTTYSFVIDVPESEYLYLRIDNNLKSINKFVHASRYDTVLDVPRYPKEVRLSGEGSILTYSGNHQLSVVTRGVSGLKYTVGKLLNGKINHLITQTRGDITNPVFNNWSYTEKDIVEYESSIVSLTPAHPKQANHSSFDLTEYLPEQENRFGLFFIEVNGWEEKRKALLTHVSDKRLILVTDLGLIVKENADNSHEVFVQSISTGLPVGGATVELLGRNGIAVLTATTDARGHASFASTKGFSQEKEPTVYVVKTTEDMSFIPFEGRSRQINLSKFDIGGVASKANGDVSLNAFLFSDRGIYRPSETVNLGVIVKNDDLSNVEGIPLEMVIRDPRSKEVKVQKIWVRKNGFMDFQYPTELTSDTGEYTATLNLIRKDQRRGAQIGQTRFKVEEFQPDTMKIQSKLEGVSNVGWDTSKTITSSVLLENLFGTAAQDRKVLAKVVVEPTSFVFDKYEAYRFTKQNFDADNKPLSLNETLAEKRTDANGQVSYDIDLAQFNNGTYSMRFFVEGFDQAGGRSVSASNSVLISPLDYIVGYKADGNLSYINANSDRNIEFISVDKTLAKHNAEELKLKLIEIQHVSTLVKQANGTYKYQTIIKEVDVESSSMAIPLEGFNYKIDTNKPGDFAVEIIDQSDRRLARAEYSVAGFANLAGKIDKNAELQVKLDKADYQPGELIKMSIKAPYVGAGLITIETNKVHQFKWFKTEQESTVQEIELPQGIEGTAYINVAFVRDVGSKEIFTSPLSYAVQPFAVDKSKREVKVDLSVAPLVRPGKPMDIKFTTSKPSRIAVFAVDEGILQVANYQKPEPLAHFLKKRQLDVETSQILDLILPDFDLVKELSASGGGSQAGRALAKNLNPFSRKTDKPAVFWSGIYDASDVEQSVSFDVPNTFSGQLRVMAVAGAPEALGTDSTSSIVRGPFVISPNVLTMAAPGDEFDVTVGVANIIEGSGKAAAVELEASSTEHLEIISTPRLSKPIDEGSEAKFNFRVKVKDNLGAAELAFKATYKDEELTRSAGLSIRPAMPYSADFTGGYVKSGELDLTLTRTLYPQLATQSVTASASPLLVVDGLTAYLKSYPHGCTEQIVSKVFPIIGLMSHPSYSASLPKVKVQFDYLIDRLRERQLGDGGFAFWPGAQRSAEYPTIYVMHFLIEAKEAGYSVPSDMLESGKKYLSWYVQQSQTWFGHKRDRANAIYLLTRMGVVTSNYLVDLEENLENSDTDWHNDILSVYMAATYKLLQKDSEAARLIGGYKISNKSPVLDDFHSSLAMDAQYIYLLSKHFSKRALKIDGQHVLDLTDRIYKGEYNTIASAYSILGLGAYSTLVLPEPESEQIEFSVTGPDNKKKVLEAIAKPFLKTSYEVDSKKLHLQSDNSLFYLNVQSGFNNTLPTESVQQGIEIFRDFVDQDGKVITSFEQGKEITVRLKVRALDGRSLRNIAIVDLLPGGFEVIRNSVPRTAYGWVADYVDIREDRVIYYGNVDSSVTELSYKVKLTSSGSFLVPPSYAESMYDRSIKASTKSSRFNVTAKP